MYWFSGKNDHRAESPPERANPMTLSIRIPKLMYEPPFIIVAAAWIEEEINTILGRFNSPLISYPFGE